MNVQPERRDAFLTRPYTVPMARRVEDLTNDPVLVLIEGDEPKLTTEEWLALLDEDEPTDVNANAAEILRDIREHGER